MSALWAKAASLTNEDLSCYAQAQLMHGCAQRPFFGCLTDRDSPIDAGSCAMRRLPPLDTLRVFEAAARLKSFKEAGDELNVTASAVSHRVAALEEELATPLFVRHTRRIEVTPQGERLAAGVRRGLAEIRRAVTSVDRRESTHIRITGIPSHVTRWLAPRLHRFRVANPEIELHITADLAFVDLTQRTFDVALRFGNGVYPGVRAEYLMDDAIFPVASPRYIAEAGPIAKPADILLLTRILDVTAEDDESGTNWRTWFAHHRLPMDSVERGMQFNGAAIALEAAAGGLGVAIARRSLVGEEIRSGRLVQVLPGEITTNWSHYALALPDMADWPPLRAFVDWLRSEASDC